MSDPETPHAPRLGPALSLVLDGLRRGGLDGGEGRALSAERRARKAEERLARTRRLQRVALIVGLPYLVLLAPVLLPVAGALAWRDASKRRRARAPSPSAAAPARFVSAAAPAPAAPHRPDPDHEARMDARADDFALFRIVGNDLVPRHRPGQSRENLAFILEHEADFPDCRKGWIVNRIVDPQEERAVLDMLAGTGHEIVHLPFDREAYVRVGFDFSPFPAPGFLVSPEMDRLDPEARQRAVTQAYRLKNAYVMHNNGARNAALEAGRRMAKWILPWDGNCFLTPAAWREIADGVRAARDRRYFVVPMQRLQDNAEVLGGAVTRAATEEPQILFRADAEARFDEAHPYGRRPKVDLLARLGVPGPWDAFPNDPWDLAPGPMAPDHARTAEVGFVARLYSGRGDLETGGTATLMRRGSARAAAITGLLDRLDAGLLAERGFDPARPLFYAPATVEALRATPDAPLAQATRAEAEAALGRGPFSVTQKTTVAPSGDRQDYWHPAPYWWPDPMRPDGLPYIQRDGERVPGTVVYGPDSDRYDRTRLQYVFDDTASLALAWRLTGRAEFRDHAALLVRAWFLDPDTRMTPHLTYAQVRRGHDGDRGASFGVIEAKDLSYFLDAVRLLDLPDLHEALSIWLAFYLQWLLASVQGRREAAAPNNHGIYYDLHVAAVAAFLGDTDTLLGRYRASHARLDQHFAADGHQPHELSRRTTAHYCAFNLQGWLTLFTLYERCGFRPFAQEPGARAPLSTALSWLLAHRGGVWPYEQIDAFDTDRYGPLSAFGAHLGLHEPDAGTREADRRIAAARPRFHPDDGIPPYWQLVAPERT